MPVANLLLPTLVTDVDWAFDVLFFSEDLETPRDFADGDNASLTFLLEQGDTSSKIEVSSADMDGKVTVDGNAIRVRLASDFLAANRFGRYAVELRRIGADGSKELLAVSRTMLVEGLSSRAGYAPAGGLTSVSATSGAASIILKADAAAVVYPIGGPQGQTGWSPFNALRDGPQGYGWYLDGWSGGEGNQPVVPAIGTFMGGAVTVGGAVVGNPGSGFYAGLTLSWAEDFNGSINELVVGPATPNAKYFPTHGYGVGPRGDLSKLGQSWDTDPLSTGWLDAGRGVGGTFTNMTVANSVLKMAARVATPAEQALFAPAANNVGAQSNLGVRNNVSAMLHTAGAIVFFPSDKRIRVEAKIRFSSKFTNPAGWHPSFWVMSAAPVLSYLGDEIDIVEGNSQNGYSNINRWAGGVATTTPSGTTHAVHDDLFHRYTVDLCNGGSQIIIYIDGVQVDQFAQDANIQMLPMFALLTAHVFNGTFNTDTYAKAAWDTSNTGSCMEVADLRVWREATESHLVPQVAVADQNVDYAGNGSVVLPSAADACGDASAAIYVQVIPHEANSPGMTEWATFNRLPVGFAWDAPSRTLSWNFAGLGGYAGRCHVAVYYTKPGSTAEPLRFAVNRGPVVNLKSLYFGTGEAVSFDLYRACDCGILVSNPRLQPAKKITIAGLGASGLSYSNQTGLLTGVAVAGNYNFAITCVNSIGQPVTTNVPVNIAAATSYTAWDGPAWYDASDTTTITASGNNVSAIANKRLTGTVAGPLVYSGTANKITKVASGQNAKNVLRVAIDVSTFTSQPRLSPASPSDPLNQMVAGKSKPFTIIIAYKPTDANVGPLFSWSETLGATDSAAVCLFRRATSASGIRRQLVAAATNEIGFGAGQASGTARVVAVRYDGNRLTVWDNSVTAKSLAAVLQDTPDMPAAMTFYLFALETGGAGTSYQKNQFGQDFYELVAEDKARSDADITGALTDIATKWAAALT